MRSPGNSHLAALALVTASAFLIAGCSEAPTVPDGSDAQLHHSPGHGGGPPGGGGGGGDDGGDEAPAYEVIDLGAAAGYTDSRASDLAASGAETVVVGSSWGPDDGFDAPTRWTVDGDGNLEPTAMVLPVDAIFGAPSGVDSEGVSAGVVGLNPDLGGSSDLVPTRWDADGMAAALPVNLTGEDGWEGDARDIATLGGAEVIVGTLRREDENGSLEAVEAAYWLNGALQAALPKLAGDVRATAHAVNSAGTIAGSSIPTGVVIWHDDGGYRICSLGTTGIANGISDPTGDNTVFVAGASGGRATLWEVDPGACVVTSTRSLDTDSEFHDVNGNGEAVGEDLRKHRAILWTGDGQLVELPSEGKGKKSAAAHGINPDGTLIVGQSASNGGATAVLWSRVP